jgi:hypothetical protein
MFPEDQDIPGRKLYQLSLYTNKHNIAADTIEKLERAYPTTHAKHKSLILGMRGPNVTGTPVYQGAFDREKHVTALAINPSLPLLEAFHAGQHHPTWLIAQRAPDGGLRLLAGILGKRLFLDDFLPIVKQYRDEWFPNITDIKTCCDPPVGMVTRYTINTILREYKYQPRWRDNGMAPDVRVSMIEYLGALMHRPAAFAINSDPTRWLMASHAVIKQTKLIIDAAEGSYVWSPHYVSVGNKTVRQPLFDEWLEGFERCIENIALNFCAGQKTDAEREAARLKALGVPSAFAPTETPNSWMSF